MGVRHGVAMLRMDAGRLPRGSRRRRLRCRSGERRHCAKGTAHPGVDLCLADEPDDDGTTCLAGHGKSFALSLAVRAPGPPDDVVAIREEGSQGWLVVAVPQFDVMDPPPHGPAHHPLGNRPSAVV